MHYGAGGFSPTPPPVAAYVPSNFPSHFAPPVHAAPSTPAVQSVPTTSRSQYPRARTSIEPEELLPPPTPTAVLAASFFLGVPLALATLVVAVLALR